jgi:hypothetical protein
VKNEEIVDNVIAIVNRHTDAEARRDYDATMATFGATAGWKLLPQNIVIDGHDAVRAFYEQLIPTLDRLGVTRELLGQWANETGVVRRDRFAHDTPDGRIEFELVSILFVKDGHVTMEHAYGWPDESLRVLGFL